MADFSLKSAQFRKEREASWRELEHLVTLVEKSGVKALSARQLNRLPSLYRSAVSSLSVARAISLDKNLLTYLTALVGRAYIAIYGTKRRARHLVADFLVYRFPTAVRKNVWFVVASLLILTLGVVTGHVLTDVDPERYYSFVPVEMASGRTPAASTESLRGVLYDSGGGVLSSLGFFATYLFTHNAKIGLMAFALGFAAGAPVLYLLFYNGLILGAMASLYASRGLGFEFWAWVMPHGVTELGAVVLCGGAGLVLGWSLLFPGPHTRFQNLALRGREAAVIAIGCVGMFLLAGLIEGFFRQIVHSVTIRWAVAGTTLLFWLWYFLFLGRRREEPDAY